MNADVESVRNPEVGPLARAMVAGLRELVESYKREYGLSTAEAVARVQENLRERKENLREREQRALQCPPTEDSWADLEWLFERDPQKFLQRWEEIKRAAREELQSGHRAPQAVELYGSTPWKRAEFLALRQELVESWQPRNGVERQLLDIMAQAQSAAEYWLKRLMAKAALEAAMELATLRKNGQWEPPRATAFQAVEQAGAMAERFNRIFLRTLRALQDLRRRAPTVIVQNVGQVNVGEQETTPRNGDTHPREKPAACTCLADRRSMTGKSG
jgi:hypothetical protein